MFKGSNATALHPSDPNRRLPKSPRRNNHRVRMHTTMRGKRAGSGAHASKESQGAPPSMVSCRPGDRYILVSWFLSQKVMQRVQVNMLHVVAARDPVERTRVEPGRRVGSVGPVFCSPGARYNSEAGGASAHTKQCGGRCQRLKWCAKIVSMGSA